MPAQLQTLSLSRLSRLRRQELVERHVLRLICLGLVALSLAGLLYLTQASAVTTTTYEIQELQREKQRLQRKRDRLRADIAAHTTPERVRERAEALGFRSSPPVKYVRVTDIPVVVHRLPGHPRAEPARAPLQILQAQLSDWLETTSSLLPAPQRVEAGSAEP